MFDVLEGVNWGELLGQIAFAIAVLSVVCLSAWLVPPILSIPLRSLGLPTKVQQATVLLVRLAVLVGGSFLVVDALGYPGSVVVAGLTMLIGVGVSIALGPYITNGAGAALLFLASTYNVGDHVAIHALGVEGNIMEITSQRVVVRASNGSLHDVPCVAFYTQVVSRVSVDVRATRGTTLEI